LQAQPSLLDKTTKHYIEAVTIAKAQKQNHNKQEKLLPQAKKSML
jgi:hypothetical protein